MQRQNIFTGVKILSPSNIENIYDPTNNNRNQDNNINNDFISIKENAVIVRSRQSFKLFKLDSCLDKNSGQQEIYDNFGLNMVEDFINGYDCTLILCGENNKKNSLTDIVLGKETQQTKGLIPRLIQQLNNSIKHFSQRKFLIKVSFLEISAQEMIDLLGVKKCKLQIKQQKINKTQFHINNLEIKPIQKVDEIQSFYLVGNRKREYAYSKDYRKRQQSSGFFTIYLQSLQESGTIYRQSKFTICELAQNVFEEVDNAKGKNNMDGTLENKFLQSTHAKRFNSPHNKSLNLSSYAFQNVINTLVYCDQQITVPYRDSKVTKLLRSALGGTHKTSILATIDPTIESSLTKTFKILKTLQIAAQIQNSPTNLKHFDQQSSNKSNITLVNFLQTIQQLSNQLQLTKITLQKLLNNQNYVSQQIQKIKQKNGHSLIKDNEFCSQQNIQDRVLQQKTKVQWELKQTIKNIQKQLKQKISFIHNLSNEDHQNDQDDDNSPNFAKEELIISKRKQILMRIRNIKQKRLISMPNLEMQQAQREKKRQLFALQIQFQKERNLYLSSLRELQEKLSLYKKIAENSLKTQEIDIIRMNSKFDETKRQFEIPLFMIKDRKMRPGHMISPVVSDRKFLISPRSSSFNSLHSNNAMSKSNKPIQAKKTLIGLSNILSRKSQKQQQYRSEYQIDNNISRDQKKTPRPNKSSRSKQLITMVARNKSPSDPIKPNKNQTLINKIRSNEHIKKVVSDYEIGEVDIERVNKYNEQRKLLKSKDKNAALKSIGARSPNKLMMRQKLNTQPPISEDQKQKKSNVLSPEKDYLPKSPRQQIKKWI